MRAGIKTICVIFILLIISLTIQAQSGKLPEKLRKILNRGYPSWQLDNEFNKRYKNLESIPFPVLSGDWNADGKIDYVVFIKHLNSSKTLIFLKIREGYIFYEIFPDDFNPNYKIPANGNSAMEKKRDNFYKNLPPEFVIPADSIGTRILKEYGAMFVAARDVITPKQVVFRDEREVQDFQAKVDKSKEIFGTLEIELQSAAMKSLKKAIKEAQKSNLTISPKESDSARRSYLETVLLWESRVTPGLTHWVNRGRLDFAEAIRIRNLEPVEQIPEIFKLEEKGMYFAKDLSKSIIYSVAPPGTSQHLSMLALDLNEFYDADVREILARHGWHQTVISDLPHFTFLGVPEAELPNLGLKKVSSSGRIYWIPKL